MGNTLQLEKSLERVRGLVLDFGWNAVAYQLLNPGISHWFAWPENGTKHDAVVGYVEWGGYRVVAGAPVCALEDLGTVIERFEVDSERVGLRVCYFGAGNRLRDYLSLQGYSSFVMGSQPVWQPSRWTEILAETPSLRAQVNRARHKGVTVSEWPVEKAHRNPELRRVLGEWLRTRGLPPLHFLVEPETLGRLGDRRIWVAERNGEPIGFLNMAPIPCRNGWLTEQFVRGRGAPNGTVELMMDTAIRVLAAEGARYITMGLVPLSSKGASPEQNPAWLKVILKLIRLHGRRFYNFEGLEAFKDKFRPDGWEPIWVVAREPRPSLKTFFAVAGAFSHRDPLALLVVALWRAARQEYAWSVTEGRRDSWLSQTIGSLHEHRREIALGAGLASAGALALWKSRASKPRP